MTSPATSEDLPDAPPDPGKRKSRVRERRAVWWGMAISLLVHLVGVALYPVYFPEPDPERPSVTPDSPEEVLPGFEVVTLQEAPLDPLDVDVPDPPLVELDDEEEPDALPQPEVPAPDLPEIPVEPEPDPAQRVDEEEADEDTRSIADRLRPGPTDARLWSNLLPERSDLTDAERANLLLEGMIQSFNDSVAVAAALRGQMEDWTFTDDEGRRWGISPGRLHLGEFSIPLPFYLEVPPGLSNDFGRRDWEIADILRGATSAEIRETWSQRAREIRERMDAERNRSGGGGGGGGGDDGG